MRGWRAGPITSEAQSLTERMRGLGGRNAAADSTAGGNAAADAHGWEVRDSLKHIWKQEILRLLLLTKYRRQCAQDTEHAGMEDLNESTR